MKHWLLVAAITAISCGVGAICYEYPQAVVGTIGIVITGRALVKLADKVGWT